ncbi:MAG: hypothetical protein JWQ45_2768 [Blastococcus sp.]|jgi:hypothetical protein|nr:hypothetical protein [Blastococcus sp.]
MKRTLALAAAWLGSAAAAVGLGFLAVSLVDASASPVATGSSTTADPSGATSTSAADTSASPSATGETATAGGTVYANCTGGPPVLAGVPVAGWEVDDSADAGKVEFRSATQKVEVRVVCTGGSPQFSVEGPRADDSGREDSTPTSASTAPAAPAAPSTSDDSSGRGGGGHGSDDPAGDDSSGRGGRGGHGSDG